MLLFLVNRCASELNKYRNTLMRLGYDFQTRRVLVERNTRFNSVISEEIRKDGLLLHQCKFLSNTISLKESRGRSPRVRECCLLGPAENGM